MSFKIVFLDKFQLHIGMKLFIILTLILFLHLPFSFLPSVSCGPSWSWVYYVVKDTLTFRFPCSHPARVPCAPQQAYALPSERQANALSAQLHPWPFLPALLSLLIGDPHSVVRVGLELVGSDGFPARGPPNAWEVQVRHCIQLNALLLFNMHGLYSSLSLFVLIIILFLCSWSIFLELYRFY